MVSAPPSSRWNVSFWVRWATGDEDSYLNLYANYAVAHRVDATSSNVCNMNPVSLLLTILGSKYFLSGSDLRVAYQGPCLPPSAKEELFANSTLLQWTRVEFPYTTGEDRNLQFVFSFVLGAAPANEVWIDKVAMSVVGAATSTGPVLAAATVTSNSVES